MKTTTPTHNMPHPHGPTQPNAPYRYDISQFDQIIPGTQQQPANTRKQQTQIDQTMLRLVQLTNIQPVTRGKHASESSIYRARLKNIPIYIKAFDYDVDSTMTKYNDPDRIRRLAYEKEVYSYLRSIVNGRLSQQSRLRNTLTESLRNDTRKYFIQYLGSVYDERTNRCYLFSEDTGGRAFEDYIKDANMSYAQKTLFKYKVFFQMLYVVYLMSQLKILHHDLHPGNVIIVPDNQATQTFNFGGNETHTINDHPFSIKVYDFDNGSIYEPSSWKNPYLEKLCKQVGHCATRPGTDIIVWLSVVLRFVQDDPLLQGFFGSVYRDFPKLQWVHEYAKLLEFGKAFCVNSPDQTRQACVTKDDIPGLTAQYLARKYKEEVLDKMVQSTQRRQQALRLQKEKQAKSVLPRKPTQQQPIRKIVNKTVGLSARLRGGAAPTITIG